MADDLLNIREYLNKGGIVPQTLLSTSPSRFGDWVGRGRGALQELPQLNNPTGVSLSFHVCI